VENGCVVFAPLPNYAWRTVAASEWRHRANAADTADNASPLAYWVVKPSVARAPPLSTPLHAFETNIDPGDGNAGGTWTKSSLELARSQPAMEDAALQACCSSESQGGTPDLVVSFGSPAGRLWPELRHRLFPNHPVRLDGMDKKPGCRPGGDREQRRFLEGLRSQRTDRGQLQLKPDTNNVVVISRHHWSVLGHRLREAFRR